jgi:serine/threonine protein kinase
MIGRTLGHYQVVEKLGEGGMGEVYKAHDERLNPAVAIKVLREELAANPERLKRFEQEARSASALNHPNIITIHDIGKHEATHYVAMEYVEGQTLRDMLSEGPFPLRSCSSSLRRLPRGFPRLTPPGSSIGI